MRGASVWVVHSARWVVWGVIYRDLRRWRLDRDGEVCWEWSGWEGAGLRYGRGWWLWRSPFPPPSVCRFALVAGGATAWFGVVCGIVGAVGWVIRCFVVEGTSFVCVQSRRRWLLLLTIHPSIPRAVIDGCILQLTVQYNICICSLHVVCPAILHETDVGWMG